MTKNTLQVNTELAISKPPHEVYEAIVDPAKMSHYFISSGTGRLDSGNQINWEWHGVEAQLPVTPQEIEKDTSISFLWSASGVETKVVILLEPLDPAATKVKVSESGWPRDDQGIARCLEQMQGWVHMLCCLKAYLEHGINLRGMA
ncbi:MAG: hypothetical protein QOH06_1255 [Acidobacteriota bacterium]|jgi:uncharacterized protein YndB with AHSA1/START domain|nr:hypothetical protein [Acidobacteriota bacterium]